MVTRNVVVGHHPVQRVLLEGRVVRRRKGKPFVLLACWLLEAASAERQVRFDVGPGPTRQNPNHASHAGMHMRHTHASALPCSWRMPEACSRQT